MKLRTMLVASALAAGGFAFSGPATAQVYLGGSVGQSDFDNGVTSGLVTTLGSADTKDTAFKFYGGYLFHPNVGVELGYVDLGAARYSGTFLGAPVTGGRVEASGFNLSAIGSLPLGASFSLFGKVGLFMWDVEARDITGGVPFAARDDGSDLSFGAGAQLYFSRNVGVRAEWERYKFDDADVDMLSAGIVYRF